MAKGIAQGLADSDGIVFPTLPAAKYNARVTKLEDVEAKDTAKHPGTPMVKVTFRVLDDDPALDGKTVTNHMMLPYAEWMDEEDNRKQLAAMSRMYVACGLEVEDEYDTDDWMGQELVVVVTESEFPAGSGKMTNNVSDVLPVD